MEVILRMVFIAFIAVSGMVINHDISSKAQTLHFLKEDLEIATHDAALEIDEDELASGRIIFDQEKAMTSLRNSFERNSLLSDEDYEIVEVRFFDEETVPSFPYEFHAEQLQYSEVINSPTLIAFVEAKQNAYYANNSSKSFMQVASYTYKPKKNIVPSLEGIVEGAANEQGFYWPVPYTRNVTSHYGDRVNPVTGIRGLHAGTDIASAGVLGTPVVPAKAGVITYAGWIGGYGNIVIVNHGGGVESRYAHLHDISVSVSQQVAPGSVLGTVGNTGNSTGPHLHFEIRIDGIPYDPMLFY